MMKDAKATDSSVKIIPGLVNRINTSRGTTVAITNVIRAAFSLIKLTLMIVLFPHFHCGF